MRKSEKGVTLIELMTVMVVLGILAAIAVPTYRGYLLRTQRSDASTALLRLQSAEEKYLLQNGVYTKDLTSAAPTGLGLPASTSEQGFYQLAVALNSIGYVATATPLADKGQKDDKKCVEFTVNQSGVRTAKDGSGTDRTSECWR